MASSHVADAESVYVPMPHSPWHVLYPRERALVAQALEASVLPRRQSCHASIRCNLALRGPMLFAVRTVTAQRRKPFHVLVQASSYSELGQQYDSEFDGEVVR